MVCFNRPYSIQILDLSSANFIYSTLEEIVSFVRRGIELKLGKVVVFQNEGTQEFYSLVNSCCNMILLHFVNYSGVTLVIQTIILTQT